MQIEAIRAHPGSAHVMGLWHSQKSFPLHEGNNNSSPAPAAAPPRPGTRDGLVRGAPESGQAPLIATPGAFRSPGEGLSQGGVSSSSTETPAPPATSPHRLLGWERRGNGGREHWDGREGGMEEESIGMGEKGGWRERASLGASLKSLFVHQVRTPAPSRASLQLRFGTGVRADALC